MTETTITRATFTPKTGSNREKVEVHFNPVSLEYNITNELEDKKQGGKTKQYVTSSSAKLTMELIFDTTYNGEDVRLHSGKIARFMQPVSESGGERQVPAVVEFAWGLYRFTGMVESFKETINFFAATGVPLRSTVNITLVSQEVVFAAADGAGAPPNEAVEVPGAQDATSLGTQAGDPNSGRGIAAANNQESMRFPSGPLTVGASVSLKAAAAFSAGASAGVGIGVSGGAGVGIGGSAGFGVGASAGVGIGGSAGIGVSGGSFSASFGGSASAGVSASAGAFAGLSTPKLGATIKLDTISLVQPPDKSSLTSSSGANFGVGGQVTVKSSAGLSADVGANASLKARIRFD